MRIRELQSAAHENNSHFTAANENLDRKFTAQNEAMREKARADHHLLSELCSSIDRKFSDRNAVQEMRIDELSSIIQEHHQSFSDLCDNLDTKYTDALRTQGERVENFHSHF